MPVNLEKLDEYPVVAVDVETTGLHWYKDKMFGVAVAVYDGKAVTSEYWDIREKPRVVEALKKELPRCQKICNHNIKFDTHFLLNEGVTLPADRIECTSVRAALINEHEPSFSLDALGKKYIGEGKIDIWAELAKLFGGAPTRGAQILNLHRAPSHLAARYAAPDPALALKLWLWQEQEIEKQELQQIWALERSVTPILIEIERQGVRVDEALAESQCLSINRKVDEAQRVLDKITGHRVNVNSPTQMREVFAVKKVGETWKTKYDTVLEKTDGGVGSLDKDALMIMANRGSEEAKRALQIRRLLKGKSFLKDHILGHSIKGRVYPNYNQTRGENEHGTRTGRLSVEDPALQQIPMHDVDVAEVVRPCFLPELRQKWACADWRQFEFRWFAHYVNDPGINAMYDKDPDADFHQAVADLTDITRDRKFAGDTANAKQINLGLVFGMGEGEMAYNMGMAYEERVDDRGHVWKNAGEEAKAIFAKYHAAIPGVKALLARASSIARARGYVKTAMGRHLRFPGARFLHKAGGLVFQGTSADCMKLKMVELWPICKREGWTYLLSVHDEHDLSIPRDHKHAISILRKSLETFDGKECPVMCRVPIRAGIELGANWWEACK